MGWTGLRTHTGAGEIWRRFPKFVLGFFAASILVTLIAQHAGHAAFSAGVAVNVVLGLVLSGSVFASYWTGLGH